MTCTEFTKWAKKYQDNMFRLAVTMLSDISKAEDVVQDVLIKIWEKRETLTAIKNPEAWCIELTKNRCIDIIKKETNEKKRAKYLPVQMALLGPEEYIIVRETEKQIKAILNELPPLQKAIFHLKEIECKNYEEISKCLKISVANVKVSVFRYRQKIKKALH